MHHSYLLWRDWFGTKKMRQLWSEKNIVNSWLKVESALTSALAESGAVPMDAAEAIQNRRNLDLRDIEKIGDQTSKTRHILAGFVKYMRDQLGIAGEYFHLGATTQDILDTSLAILIKDSLESINRDIRSLLSVMTSLADKHRHTVMPGRSQGQHALPITFGFKVALWASELLDHLKRLNELEKRVLVVSTGAAVGTQASFVLLNGKENTLDMAKSMARRLELQCPVTDVHGRVDRFSELLNYIALFCTFLGEIGLELRDLQRTEVAEIKEKWKASYKGSSTLLHKQNPEPAHWLEGLAKITRGNSVAMMDVQIQHERDATRTAPEFATISESFLCLSASLQMAEDILTNIDVDSAQMQANLEKTSGLMMSEAVWIRLFQKTGRLAHSQHVVKSCANAARDGGISFKQALLEHEIVAACFTNKEIDEMLNPKSYLGTIAEQINVVIKSAASETNGE